MEKEEENCKQGANQQLQEWEEKVKHATRTATLTEKKQMQHKEIVHGGIMSSRTKITPGREWVNFVKEQRKKPSTVGAPHMTLVLATKIQQEKHDAKNEFI